jgi:hypothetical protein
MQFKTRKHFINLCCHEDDFGLDAEWDFLEVSHGRHTCGGTGRTVKRLAGKQSQQNAEQIMMSRQLYKWAVVEFLNHLRVFYFWRRQKTSSDARREIQESSDTSGYTKVH